MTHVFAYECSSIDRNKMSGFLKCHIDEIRMIIPFFEIFRDMRYLFLAKFGKDFEKKIIWIDLF